nr:MAG TPA: hypothetical protein [Caudoviricetes sp.]
MWYAVASSAPECLHVSVPGTALTRGRACGGRGDLYPDCTGGNTPRRHRAIMTTARCDS